MRNFLVEKSWLVKEIMIFDGEEKGHHSWCIPIYLQSQKVSFPI